MKTLNDRLCIDEFLCGATMTLIDICVYFELHTCLVLLQREVDRDKYTELFAWFHKLSEVSVVKDLNQRFMEVLGYKGILQAIQK